MPQASFAHILVMAKRVALSRLLLAFGGNAFDCELDRAVNLIAERPTTSGRRAARRGPAHQLVNEARPETVFHLPPADVPWDCRTCFCRCAGNVIRRDASFRYHFQS